MFAFWVWLTSIMWYEPLLTIANSFEFFLHVNMRNMKLSLHQPSEIPIETNSHNKIISFTTTNILINSKHLRTTKFNHHNKVILNACSLIIYKSIFIHSIVYTLLYKHYLILYRSSEKYKSTLSHPFHFSWIAWFLWTQIPVADIYTWVCSICIFYINSNAFSWVRFGWSSKENSWNKKSFDFNIMFRASLDG